MFQWIDADVEGYKEFTLPLHYCFYCYYICNEFFKGITSKYLAASVSHDFVSKKLLNIHIHDLHVTVFKEKSKST